MVNIVLHEPEIPANTGNIARTCAATGSRLHLIKPLGFDISEKAVKRAGLDYWHLVDITVYENLDDFFSRCGDDNLILATTKAPKVYTEGTYTDGCYIMFGKETKGLDEVLLKKYYEKCVRVPMREEARSLNLSNTVAILCYEALKNQGFPGLMEEGTIRSE